MVEEAAQTIASSTVRRELTLIKSVIDYRKRRLGILINPVNTEDMKRPAANDERDVRLSRRRSSAFSSPAQKPVSNGSGHVLN